MIALSPLFGIVAAAIAWEEGGPVFYTPRRVGLHGKIFRIYKFRTMVRDADKMGPGITGQEDRRITRVGGFLRHYKLDEFPQLINVIRGDMNLVGPRPEDPRYTGTYDAAQLEIFRVRPGMTSPASLQYRNESTMLDGDNVEDMYVSTILPAKLRIDLDYFKGNTLASDFRLIARTVSVVFHGRTSVLSVVLFYSFV
jgi:lipopolysaccharide/colanic/teichoic acid biosynthesis glycosyltransferase